MRNSDIRDYYKNFFPIKDRSDIMREQISLSQVLDGFSPRYTDDMVYADFKEWMFEASDFIEDMKEDG